MTRSGMIPVLEALTRSDIRRDLTFSSGGVSDEDLLRRVAPPGVDPQRMRLLSSVSRLLRLMDALLVGRETGEGFVAKFSEQWLSLQDWDADPVLEAEFDNLNEFYSEIQLFCPVEEHRREEPLLFGLDRLKDLTHVGYDRLKQSWSLSLVGPAK